MALALLRQRKIVQVLIRFWIVFGLLIFPWPNLDNFYGAYFRLLGTLAFSRESGPRMVRFDPHELRHGFSTLGTEMILGNRYLVDSSGKGAVTLVDLDTRSIGWVPTALTIALILATPMPWRRACWALLWGIVLIHLFILLSLQAAIWDQSPVLSLGEPSPMGQWLADALYYTLITQMGASFAAPVVIWIAVTFRAGSIVTKNGPPRVSTMHTA
jgi:hypothetical protein